MSNTGKMLSFRARPVKSNSYVLVLAVFGLTFSAYGAQEFVPCETVAHRYPQTHEILNRGDSCSGGICFDNWRKGRCLMLNDHELIYEDEETGTNFQGLYYVNLNKPEREPKQLTSHILGISEHVVTGQHWFAIVLEGYLSQGHESTGISVFHFTPTKKPGFLVQDLIHFGDNSGCATRESDVGCGEEEHTFSFNDSSGRSYTFKSKKPITATSFPPSVRIRKGVAMIELNLDLTKKTLALRYRSRKNQTGFFLENWGEAIKALDQEIRTMANQPVQGTQRDKAAQRP